MLPSDSTGRAMVRPFIQAVVLLSCYYPPSCVSVYRGGKGMLSSSQKIK